MASVGSLDEDEDLHRVATTTLPSFSVPPSWFSYGSKSPLGVGAASSSLSSLPEERPVMWRLLSAQKKIEDAAERDARYFEEQSNEIQEKLKALSQQRAEMVRKNAEETGKKDTWSAYADTSRYLVNTAAIGAAWFVGGWAGILLAASGACGLGTQIAKDTGLLEEAVRWYTQSEELQKQIAKKIEVGSLLLQLGFGLSGGLASAKGLASAAFDSQAILSYLQVFNVAASAVSLSLEFGKSYHGKKQQELIARLKEIEAEQTTTNEQLNAEIQSLKDTGKTIHSSQDAAKTAIKTFHVDVN